LPGGLFYDDHGGVAPPPLPPVLARADAAGALPRLGGMARATGVVIVSERYWAFAGTDGSLSEGEMPHRGAGWRRLPLVRGLARLSASLSPLFRGRGVAGRGERILLAAALIAPFLFFLLPERAGVVAGIALTAGLLFWLLRGRTLHLHGAEHRAIAAVEERRLHETWAGEARPTRFAARCGTNFAALVLPVTVLADRLWPLPTSALVTPLVVTLVSLALTMELWRLVQGSSRRVARLLLLPGLGLQRLTTREPSLEETRLALVAAASVLHRELEHPA
jgi:uncharacterized protein YqhQ